MDFETNLLKREGGPRLDIEAEYVDFVPAEFKDDPLGYVEVHGKNMRSGEIQKDETGKIREDPTAVKELPAWMNARNEKLETVAKRINVDKAKIRKFSDPFYEYKMMKIVLAAGLPAAKPIAQVELGDSYLLIMEKLPGIGWHEKGISQLREAGCSEEDIKDIERQALEMIPPLREKFEKEGVRRRWYLKDMILNIDFARKRVINITPIDWERAKIEEEETPED